MDTPCRRLCRLLAVLAVVLAVSGLGALPARASDETPSSWRITRYQTDAQVAANGTARVRTSLDFDFGTDEGHGPFLTFVTRQAIEGDRDHWRRIDIDDVRVSSPTGAPAQVETEREDGAMLLRVGDPDREVRGVQTYVVEYTLHGIVDPRNVTSGLDEVNWSVVGDGWQVPLKDVSVNLTLPAAGARTACFVAEKTPCSANTTSGRTVRFRQPHLDSGQPLRVVAGLPAGSFVGAEPRLDDRINPIGSLRPTPANALGAAVIVLAGAGLVLRTVRRHGRDEAYAGLTPGLAPAPSDSPALVEARRKAPVAVQFTPPADTTPGEVGTLLDERADVKDVVATLLDLAVRGHLRIEQVDKRTWRFVELDGPRPEAEHERMLLRALFAKGGTVTTKQLRKERYAKLVPDAQEQLYRQVTAVRGWYRTNPKETRTTWLVMGGVLAVLGLGLAAVGLYVDTSLPGLALALVGGLVMACSSSAPARTAEGSAVLAQAKGFELYLRTAEADQLRFEEGEDIFSRYLPWAVMLGVAERWTKLFQQLAAEGRYDLQPTWYAGPGGFNRGFFYGSMTSLGSSLTSSMESSMQAAQAASVKTSGGGSGFSAGGGGFGGGGGGGW